MSFELPQVVQAVRGGVQGTLPPAQDGSLASGLAGLVLASSQDPRAPCAIQPCSAGGAGSCGVERLGWAGKPAYA